MSAGTALSVSGNGRHFISAGGRPFFWLGDTQWNLWRCHSYDDAATILESRAAKRFSIVQVMLCGWGMGLESDPVFRVPAPTTHGEAYPERDPLKPNQEFFRHVDAVVEKAEALGLTLSIGLDHPRLRLATPGNAHAWGRWVGARYRSRRNIIWSPSYLIPDGERLAVTRSIAEGLREGDGGAHIMSCHPDPADPWCTSGVAHGEPWLAFNTIQTWKRFDLIPQAIGEDYRRSPPKPVVMAEGAYEGGAEYGFPVTAHLVRKQAYWTSLSGGHHSYGHNDNWQVLDSWRQSLDAPGARQMGVYRSLMERVSWWDLVPDQSLVQGDPGKGARLIAAARSGRGEWIMVYVPEPARVSVRSRDLGSRSFRASWADPRTGEVRGEGELRSSAGYTGSTPAGMEDALLILGPA